GKAASVHSHALISITDNRGGDRQPAYYFNYALSTFFNEAISGMGGWASGITVKGWHEAYNTWQLLGGSNTNSPGEWYFREGIASFGAVKRIWHSGNFDPATKLGINATAADSDKLDGKHASEFSASCYLVNQTTHGFSVGDAIKMSGSTWVKVIADSIANAGVSALVFSVTDANNFKYITSGLLTGAYTAGADYYSSTISAGALMTLSTPEVWTAGQVRQYIGTGVAGGLLIDIDAGDEIATSAFNDIYVTGMSFNNANRVLTLTRSASMPDLSIAIPFPEEEMGYEFRDITKGVAQTYVLDMKVSWPYTIKSIVCESDGTLTGVSVKINTTAVTGLSSLSVGTKAETSATAANVTVAGDVVTINTATSYSGTPTIMRLKIKYQRL
ncbi:MAG: hypothetical protein Q8M88_07345, partial [Phenylobacterium sp.]|uniref:hypothetical protein n=1 Tax=Phenylobacterium sp. TaxID=1871053 RepID=UPI002732605B